MRERYVSQRKQGDPPVYEHLSRPYLEKMKFLDQHIQPRKSYRNVPNFLTSPHSANGSSFNDYNMDSKSNSSLKSIGHFGQHHHFQDQQHAMNALSTAAAAASALESDSRVKIEADQVFRDFAAAVASQHGQLTPMLQSYNEHFRDAATNALSAVVANTSTSNGNNGLHSSSSSMKSPLSSPLGATQNGSNSAGHSTSTPNHHVAAASSSSNNNLNNSGASSTAAGGSGLDNGNPFNGQNFNDSHHEDMDSSSSSNYTKKPRVQLNNTSAENTLHHNGSLHHNSLATNSSNHPHHQLNNSNNSQFGATNGGADESDEDSDENSASMMQTQSILNDTNTENPFTNLPAASPAPSNASSSNALQRSNSTHLATNTPNGNPQTMFPTNADFLFQLYQQLPQHQNNLQQHQQHQQHQQQQQQFSKFQVPQTPPATPVQRSSEQLLGELVTTELLKMSKERRKSVQKRILEILFFDD